jgi:aryl-alcohol dehydrogenase-like predicted oxidoreductase
MAKPTLVNNQITDAVTQNTNNIEKRKCGRSDIEISVFGIGCWSYGGGDYWGPQAQEDVNAVASAALDAGINFFDTAEGYNSGRSEEALAAALKGRRHEVVIGSKFGMGEADAALVRQKCEDSLRRLETDYIDIYMVHWPIPEGPVEEVFATLIDLKSEGKIRSIGVSNFGVEQLSEALATGAQIDVNQLCYNLLSRGIELEILPLCQTHEIGILGYMPLLQGILTGKYRTAEEIPPVHSRFRHFRGDRLRASHGEAGAEAEMFEALDGIRALADELGVPMSRLALAWTITKPGITCTLVGTRELWELQENLHAASLSLSPETVARLDELTELLLRKLGGNVDYFQGTRIR